jgi:hypothetical protein
VREPGHVNSRIGVSAVIGIHAKSIADMRAIAVMAGATGREDI